MHLNEWTSPVTYGNVSRDSPNYIPLSHDHTSYIVLQRTIFQFHHVHEIISYICHMSMYDVTYICTYKKYIDKEELYKIIWLLNERWFCRLCIVQSFPVKTKHVFLTSWVGLRCISTVFYSPWHPRWRKFELDVLWNDATSCTSSNKYAERGKGQ